MLSLVLSAVMGLAGDSAGQIESLTGGSVSVTPSEGRPGTELHARGAGCLLDGRPAEAAFVMLTGPVGASTEPLRTNVDLPVSSNGSYEGVLPVPRSALEGQYHVSASCRASDMVFGFAETSFLVLPGGPLPTTVATAPTSTTTPLSTTNPVVREPLDRTG